MEATQTALTFNHVHIRGRMFAVREYTVIQPAPKVAKGQTVPPHVRTVVVGLVTLHRELHIGIARCSSKDRFVRKVGVAKARGRAHSAMYHGDPEQSLQVPADLSARELQQFVNEKLHGWIQLGTPACMSGS